MLPGFSLERDDDTARTFGLIDASRKRMFDVSRKSGIPLHRMEFIVPFVDTDFSLQVYFFLETDEQIHTVGREQWRSRLGEELLDVLRSLDYPQQWLTEVAFEIDSHENVVRNFEGSYFYRMR